MARLRSIISYAFLLAALLFFLVFLQSYFIFLLLVLFLVFPLFSVLTGRMVFRHLTLTVSPKEPQAPKESGSSFHIRIHKPFFLPLGSLTLYFHLENLCYPAKEEHSITFSLPAGRSLSLSLPFSSGRAGCIRFSAKRLEGRDILGLAVFRRLLSAENEILILPSRLSLSLPDIGLSGSGRDDRTAYPAAGQLSSDVTDFRDYRPGDRMQAIHWKLSVKNTRGSGEPSQKNSLKLVVKEYERPSAAEPRLLLELCRHPEGAPDAVIDLAYSLGCLLLEEQKAFQLCWYSRKERELKTDRITASFDFLISLTRLFYDGLYEEPDLAYREYESRTEAGGMFYLCPLERGLQVEGEALCRCRDQAVLISC